MTTTQTRRTRQAKQQTGPVVDPDRIQYLDPHELIVDVDANVRVRTELDETFLASVRENGVQEPVTAVLTTDGAVRVERGHRRTLAARETGRQVPVRVVALESAEAADQVERIVRQVDENERRAGLTEADHVKVAVQLTALDLTADQVAKKTRRTRDQVAAALAVARSQTAQAVVDRYELDVTQAAVVAEFEDDHEVVKVLVAAATTGQFDHVAQRARDARADAARREVVAAPLRAAGITVLDRRKDLEQVRTFHSLESLVDARTGAPLTVEAHAQCPGHAATIREEWVSNQPDDVTDADDESADADQPGTPDGTDSDDPDDATQDDGENVSSETDDEDEDEGGRFEMVAVFGCINPRQHGHRMSWERADVAAGPEQEPLTPDEQAAAERARKEAASAERRDVLASNKAWRSAETVRRRWLTEFVNRKAAPKGASAFLAVAQARDPEVLADVKGNHYAAELMGLPKPSYGHSADVAKAVESAPSGRVQLVHLVLTLAAYEARTQITDWRRPSAPTDRYLSYLEQIGYKLSPVEERALGRRTDLGE